MNIWNSLAGMVSLELTSADPSGALNLMQKNNIPVYDLENGEDLQLRFRILRRDHRKLRLLLTKRGDSLRILHKEGLFWGLLGLRKRPVLVIGLSILLAISLWVPGRVFFVQVEGNTSVPTLKILQQAASCGIGFGASRREVRSEKMKNALLSICPELQWAGVNTYGCIAVITVRERSDPEKQDQPKEVSSIVALRDGIIREITVLQGTAQCKPGQAVKAGQILVSGYTDCGIYIQATHAQGEIWAQTQRSITAVFPSDYENRTQISHQQKNFALIIGKKRINFSKDSGISSATCAKIVTDYPLTLPGGFVLPVSLMVETLISYETLETFVSPDPAAMESFASGYLQSQMLAGRIEKTSNVLTELEGILRLDGVYSCYEMIGVDRKEENLEDYVENH